MGKTQSKEIVVTQNATAENNNIAQLLSINNIVLTIILTVIIIVGLFLTYKLITKCQKRLMRREINQHYFKRMQARLSFKRNAEHQGESA